MRPCSELTTVLPRVSCFDFSVGFLIIYLLNLYDWKTNTLSDIMFTVLCMELRLFGLDHYSLMHQAVVIGGIFDSLLIRCWFQLDA